MTQAQRLTPELRDQAFRWIADDVDTETRAELQVVLANAMGGDSEAIRDLTDRMSGSLEFGTAGLRGPVRAGPNGMNTAVVIRTTAGVAAWLTQQGLAGETVIIGRDARHGSEAFAAAAAEVLVAAGFNARLLPRPLPTPLVAFAVRHLDAAAGIQITASHNPPVDNGYKLYDGSGSQIIPPADQQIEQLIAQAPGSVSVPRLPGANLIGEEILQAYLSKVVRLPRGTARELRIAATALHGVGAEILQQALEKSSFVDLHFVDEQSDPDPDFPTVPFPNPEEPGATDLLLALAEKVNADLAIAVDPDADRCAIGVHDQNGQWRMLRGDETGSILGEYILSTSDSTESARPLVATTIVSSSLLGKIAKTHNADYTETLTGFKWLGRVGDNLVFAYEEALGLCVDPSSVRDKDGISAAVVACDLAAKTKQEGKNLLDKLDSLAISHGVHLTDQVSLRVDDLSIRETLMTKTHAEPPRNLGGIEVELEDLTPKADVVRLRGAGVRVVIRPSGTEPKLKAYLEVIEPVTSPEGLSSAREHAAERLRTIYEEISAFLR
jgi:phosphomannomutase